MHIDQTAQSARSAFPLTAAILRSLTWSAAVDLLLAGLLAGLFFCLGSAGIHIVVQIIGLIGYSLLCTVCGSDSSGALLPWSFVVSFVLGTLVLAAFRFVHLYFLHDVTRTA